MIRRDAHLHLERVALHDLHVHEHQRRYPDRLTHYLQLLDSNDTDDLGVIHVKPTTTGYEILDGHHRYCALVMAGRPDALCLVIDET